MSLFNNLDKLAQQAKSNIIRLDETGMVVDPIGEIDASVDNGRGLEFDAVVVVSHVASIEAGTTVRVCVSGGNDPLPPKKMYDNLMQGYKPTVNTESVVLEKVVINQADNENMPVVSARWAHKAGGADRQLVAGMTGPDTMNFNFVTEEGKTEHVTVVVGDNDPERLKRLEIQLGRWQRAVESGNEEAIDKQKITVSHILAFPQIAMAANTPDEIIAGIKEAVSKDANMAFIRLYDPDTKKATVINMRLRENGEPMSEEKLVAQFETQVVRAIRNNPNLQEQVLANAVAEIIPAARLYMASSKGDFSKSTGAKFVADYLKSSDKRKSFEHQVQPRGHYFPKIDICTAYTDDNGKAQLGGYVRSVIGTTEGGGRILALETENVSGLKSVPRPESVKDRPEEDEHDAVTETTETSTPVKEAPAAEAARPDVDGFDDFPDFGAEADNRSRARP